ncbi:DUF1499 domain-containing protein [Rhodovulum sp. 12E13]|uniref:DUF1499 domain-containing protein n=1 Tax=Rhodovulum sp. 12E13 TaxID=2203891 RepID=UPI000E19470C|nr:DUF1499 domain-containing protein [Rhodovulum sp. 12E13]RDC72516.1 DUF1499 domain-containing protein [Rhodovulum sp. 12E13]
MRVLVWIVVVIVVVVLGFAAWVRLAPTDPAAWHVDPASAEPGPGRFVVNPEGGDADGPLLAMPPREALAALDAIARDTPRTRAIAGSVEEGRITYLTRSALWGFPDFTTVEAVPAEGGSRLVIFARLRFGQDDMGVNEARVRGWLSQLSP